MDKKAGSLPDLKKAKKDKDKDKPSPPKIDFKKLHRDLLLKKTASLPTKKLHHEEAPLKKAASAVEQLKKQHHEDGPLKKAASTPAPKPNLDPDDGHELKKLHHHEDAPLKKAASSPTKKLHHEDVPLRKAASAASPEELKKQHHEDAPKKKETSLRTKHSSESLRKLKSAPDLDRRSKREHEDAHLKKAGSAPVRTEHKKHDEEEEEKPKKKKASSRRKASREHEDRLKKAQSEPVGRKKRSSRRKEDETGFMSMVGLLFDTTKKKKKSEKKAEEPKKPGSEVKIASGDSPFKNDDSDILTKYGPFAMHFGILFLLAIILLEIVMAFVTKIFLGGYTHLTGENFDTWTQYLFWSAGVVAAIVYLSHRVLDKYLHAVDDNNVHKIKGCGTCFTLTFFGILFLAGVLSYFTYEIDKSIGNLSEIINTKVEKKMSDYFGTTASGEDNKMVDYLQSYYMCCGWDGPQNWMTLTNSTEQPGKFQVPHSCCKKSRAYCDFYEMTKNLMNQQLNQIGCVGAIKSEMNWLTWTIFWYRGAELVAVMLLMLSIKTLGNGIRVELVDQDESGYMPICWIIIFAMALVSYGTFVSKTL